MSLITAQMWLGMNNIKNGIIPNTWQYDNTKVDFVGFLKNYPSKDETQTAVIMQHSEGEEFGMWKNRKPDNPSYPGNCFCSKNAINGAPDPPSYPQVPDFSQWCDKNWWLLDSGTVPRKGLDPQKELVPRRGWIPQKGWVPRKGSEENKKFRRKQKFYLRHYT